jgi:hypothetical protein
VLIEDTTAWRERSSGGSYWVRRNHRYIDLVSTRGFRLRDVTGAKLWATDTTWLDIQKVRAMTERTIRPEGACRIRARVPRGRRGAAAYQAPRPVLPATLRQNRSPLPTTQSWVRRRRKHPDDQVAQAPQAEAFSGVEDGLAHASTA